MVHEGAKSCPILHPLIRVVPDPYVVRLCYNCTLEWNVEMRIPLPGEIEILEVINE